jgi:hypothetical protein
MGCSVSISGERGRCGVSPQKGSTETQGSVAGEGFPRTGLSRHTKTNDLERESCLTMHFQMSLNAKCPFWERPQEIRLGPRQI